MERFLEWDGQVLLWLKETFAHPLLNKIMIFISALGDAGFLWIALGMFFLLLGFRNKVWWKRGWMVLFSLAGNAVICNIILKPLINRTRPYMVLEYDILIPPVGDASFPSGHTSASFAAATALYAINRKWGIAAYIFAVLMGFSRLYLGVHFPTDVAAGAVIGTVAAWVVLWLMGRRFINEK